MCQIQQTFASKSNLDTAFWFLIRVMLLGNIYLVVGYAEYERVFVLSRSSLKKGM